MYFSQRLKELRKSRGMTQEQLANVLDIPTSTIRRLESVEGKPLMERAELIADYFGVSLDYLMGRSDVPNASTAQAMNEVMKIYSRLPQDRKKTVDELIEMLDQK